MLHYGIMGTNWLSHRYRRAMEKEGDCVAAVCSRSLLRARELAGEKTAAYDDLDAMLKDPNVEAVYLCIRTGFMPMRPSAACGLGNTSFAKSRRLSPQESWKKSSGSRKKADACLRKR